MHGTFHSHQIPTFPSCSGVSNVCCFAGSSPTSHKTCLYVKRCRALSGGAVHDRTHSTQLQMGAKEKTENSRRSENKCQKYAIPSVLIMYDLCVGT